MRVDSLVLFTSCALLASASDASNVRGNPITSHDNSANVESHAEIQQGVPVKRLQKAKNEPVNDEERWRFDWLFRTNKNKLLTQVLTKEDGSTATALEVFQHPKFKKLDQAFKKEKDTAEQSLMMVLSEKLNNNKDMAMALYQLKKSKKLNKDDAVELMNEQFSYLRYLSRGDGVDDVLGMLMKTNDKKNPLTMFDGEIEVLENYIKWRYPHKTKELERILLFALAEGAGDENKFYSLVSTHHANPVAKQLEERIYKFISRWPVGEANVVKRLFEEGKMEKMGPKLLNSPLLNMLQRFYIKSSKSDHLTDVTAKVMALRKGFGDDKKVASLISKAKNVKNKETQNAAKEMETEYLKQVEEKIKV